jgi:hypothetical protein
MRFRSTLLPLVSPALGALLAWQPIVARADIYVCRTPSGVMMTTDHLSTDCLRYGGKQLNPDGSVRRLILTPQQQNEQDAQARQQRDAREQQRRQQREQRALLTRFPDRASFDQALRNDLQTPLSLIASARQRLARLAANVKGLNQEAQFYPGGNYPAELRGKFEENKVLTEQERGLIAGQEHEMAQIRAQYADMLPQLKALWSRQAADQADNAAAP